MAFEGTILIGALANFAGLIVLARLGRGSLPRAYDRRFSQDRFGLLVECDRGETDEVARRLRDASAEEIRVIES